MLAWGGPIGFNGITTWDSILKPLLCVRDNMCGLHLFWMLEVLGCHIPVDIHTASTSQLDTCNTIALNLYSYIYFWGNGWSLCIFCTKPSIGSSL